jgi:hypothetical protein
MFSGPFPPLPDPRMFERRMRRLAAQASLAVHDQHLVSRVLLGQFAAPIGQGGAAQAWSLSLEHPDAEVRGRGLHTCGQAPIPDFVRFASRSLEEVWGRVENDMHATYTALRNGSALQSQHLEQLRDLIAIHHARSVQYYAVFEDSLRQARQQSHRFWEQYPRLLDAIAVSRLGLPGGGDAERELAFRELQRPINTWIEDGAMFRIMMESRYRRTKHWLRGVGVEIVSPSRGEFIIGDIPALAVRKGLPNAGVNGGIGLAVADAIVLPVAPDLLVRVLDGPSRYITADEEEVRELNDWQVRAAFRYVYLRPGTGMVEQIRSVERPRPSEGIYRDFYQLCETVEAQRRAVLRQRKALASVG